MKHYLLIGLLSFIFHLKAQNDIGVIYNSDFSGRSVDIMFAKKFNEKHQFGIGPQIFVNSLIHYDDKELYHKKRLYYTNVKEQVGLHLFYDRHIQLSKIKPSVYLFGDLQFKYASTRNVEHPKAYYDSINDIQFYYRVVKEYGPFLWLQNSYGIGFEELVFNKIVLTQKVGYGLAFIHGKDSRYEPETTKSWYYGAWLINVGISYRFNNEMKKKSE